MSSTCYPYARRLASLSVSLIVSVGILAGCDDSPTNPVVPDAWDAVLVGVGEYEAIEGAGVVASTATSFNAEILIENAEAGAVFTWRVAAGTCEDPGDRVGAADRYPDLEIDEDGTATAQASVTAALDLEADYILLVLDESGDEELTVACGALDAADAE